MSDQQSLFQADESEEPLAARMRPRTVEEFVGQEHILGEGRLLRRAIQADMLTSVIFAGPPGTGKTTLARVIANTTRSRFLSLNAVLSGVKDVRAAIEEAKSYREHYGLRTILFVDEVHRWNKAQQDALLPWVENGTVVLIGATTENPFFEVNAALVSRSRVFQLRPLGSTELYRIARQALGDAARGYGAYDVVIDEDALDHLVGVADGDARSLLNALQLAVETTPSTYPPPPGTEIHVTREVAEDSIQQKAVLYDKEGDYHFDTISAFIKSLRGSDPDAGLYWMARMIAGGEDPRYIFRRMLILASEDIGLADPQALVVVEAAARAFDRVGMPEGQFHLTHAALYLANCPKSNSTLGYFDALRAVQEEARAEVPRHLRDANRDAQGFGHGEGYLYPHAYTDHWVEQNYLPVALRDRIFYQPSDQGWEGGVRVEVHRRREIQLSLMTEETEDDEVLTFTPEHNARGRWLSRLAQARGRVIAEARDLLTAGLARHDTVLVAGATPLPLLWEAVRRAPEGGVYAVVSSHRVLEAARAQAAHLPEVERPVLAGGDVTGVPASGQAAPGEAAGTHGGADAWPAHFDRIIGRSLLARRADRRAVLALLAPRLTPGGRLLLAEGLPSALPRLSSLARDAGIDDAIRTAVERAEAALFTDPDNALFNWGPADLADLAEGVGLAEVSVEKRQYADRRQFGEREFRAWVFGRAATAGDAAGPAKPDGAGSSEVPEPRSYAAYLAAELSPAQREKLVAGLCSSLCGREVAWPTTVVYLEARAV